MLLLTAVPISQREAAVQVSNASAAVSTLQPQPRTKAPAASNCMTRWLLRSATYAFPAESTATAFGFVSSPASVPNVPNWRHELSRRR